MTFMKKHSTYLFFTDFFFLSFLGHTALSNSHFFSHPSLEVVGLGTILLITRTEECPLPFGVNETTFMKLFLICVRFSLKFIGSHVPRIVE